MFKTLVKNFGEKLDLRYLSTEMKEKNKHIFLNLKNNKDGLDFRNYSINSCYSDEALACLNVQTEWLELSNKNELKYSFFNTYGKKDEIVEIIINKQYKDANAVVKFYEDLLKLDKYKILATDTFYPLGKDDISVEKIILGSKNIIEF